MKTVMLSNKIVKTLYPTVYMFMLWDGGSTISTI